MAFISITRLRVRAWRFMPGFALHTFRSLQQVRQADGFVRGWLLADRRRVFWTMTVWRDPSQMRGYITSGDHLKAMPRLVDWCDEASVVHWLADDVAAPDWREAERRMRTEGRASKVRCPSPHHQDLSFSAPRSSDALPVTPRPVRHAASR